MQAQSAGNALARSSERCRTLVACGGAVWIWPGIPLTVRRGAEIVPLPDATISFWVSRLHGPEVLDSPHPPHIAPISILSQIGGRKSLTCPKRGVRFLRALTLPPSLQRRPKRLTSRSPCPCCGAFRIRLAHVDARCRGGARHRAGFAADSA